MKQILCTTRETYPILPTFFIQHHLQSSIIFNFTECISWKISTLHNSGPVHRNSSDFSNPYQVLKLVCNLLPQNDSIGEERSKTAISINMNESNSTVDSPIKTAPERNVDDEPQVHALTQEEVIEKIGSRNAPLTKQLEDLIRLFQSLSTAQHAASYPRAGTSASFTAAGYPPDNVVTSCAGSRTCKRPISPTPL